jgi:hypothetical protein
MYSDFSFCEGAKYNTQYGDKSLPILLIYDIGCEWSINFLRRVEACPSLSWNHQTEPTVAVGKWHLAAHVKECFCKFSLNFILGAGHLDGEIMETVWSKLNGPGRTARSMSLAYRLQFLDHHIRDMNFKKMISMGEWSAVAVSNHHHFDCTSVDSMLCSKLKRANAGIRATSKVYEEHCLYVGEEKQRQYMEKERKAQTERGEALRIYEVSSEDGQSVPSFCCITNLYKISQSPLKLKSS